MKGYDLSNFKNGKAFIHFDGVINGKSDYGPRICINTKGEKLFELPDRDMIVDSFEDEDVAFVEYKGKEALLNSKGEFLTDFIYDSIYGGSEEGFFEVERNGKHGHIDINGKEVIPCIYDEGNYFSEGVASECLNGKWGMVDCHNNTVIPFEYEEICICKNNLINAKKNGKYGLINKSNKIVVDFIYDEIDCWTTRECKVYPACKDDKWGLINRNGEVIEDFIYDDSQLISDNEDNAGEFIILLKGDKKAIYSTKKQGFITDFKYDFIGFLSEQRFAVFIDNKLGYIDTEGNEITPIIFDEAHRSDFMEGVAVVLQNGKFGMINLMGEIVIPCKYENLYYCREGLILATDSDGNTGYIDRTGDVIIPFGQYHSDYSFHCGLAQVYSKEHGNVYINKSGEILEIKL